MAKASAPAAPDKQSNRGSRSAGDAFTPIEPRHYWGIVFFAQRLRDLVGSARVCFIA
jgi:hypothetical protein